MSLIAGFDYDSKAIHVVMLDTDTNAAHYHCRRINDAHGDSFARARRVRDAMPARAHWSDSGVVLVAIEATLSRQRNAIAALSRVQGAILACLPAGIPVVPIRAQKWKQLTVGKANASKADVRAWALERLDVADGWSQDAFDAFAIAWAARELDTKAAAA
jgi:hypothetical protein